MSEPEPEQPVDEERELYVVDPDDYQKTKKLKAIHETKQYVREVRNDDPGLANKKEWRAYKNHLARAVADYGNELLPIIEDGLEEGILDEEDVSTELGPLNPFIKNDGKLVDYDTEEIQVPDQCESMVFYRQLERIQRKLGLGLEIEEDSGPAHV